MRLGDEDPSGNFIDRTGRGGMSFGGGGGNLLGCLVPLVASRFGLIGVLVLLLGYCALTQLGGGGGLIPSRPSTTAPSGQSTLDPNLREVMTRVLGSTERRWSEIFQRNGQTYRPTTMVAYSNVDQSGCGVAQAAMGTTPTPRASHKSRRFTRRILSIATSFGIAVLPLPGPGTLSRPRAQRQLVWV